MDKLKDILEGGRYRKGAYLALVVAFISGFSVYINKFAVDSVSDSFLFTATKNIAVSLLLFAFLILPRALPELRGLSGRQWITLGAIGCIGGSIPFLLFFHGLSLGTAVSAAFIHKTLFLWVAILATIFLGERLGKIHIAALGVLVGGNILLLGWPGSWLFGEGELMVLLATLLWAIEAIIAKKVMSGVSPNVAAFGRMFFGAVVMLVYLALAGKMGTMVNLSVEQVGWIALTSLFLFGYVSCYYSGLKYAPASIVASILVLGSVITSLLYAIFDAESYSPAEVAGMVLIIIAALAIWYVAPGVRVEKESLSMSTPEG